MTVPHLLVLVTNGLVVASTESSYQVEVTKLRYFVQGTIPCVHEHGIFNHVLMMS